MRFKKDSDSDSDPDLDILKQAGQLGGGVAATAGLKGALNSILSGKAKAVAKMLPKALGRGAGAAGLAMALSPDDVSPGASEVERKLEAGEPLSEDDALQLQLMKDEAAEGMARAKNKAEFDKKARSSNKELNRMILEREIAPTEEELQDSEPVGKVEEESMIDEPVDEDKQMRIEDLLKELKNNKYYRT